jgi:hypothetical protein
VLGGFKEDGVSSYGLTLAMNSEGKVALAWIETYLRLNEQTLLFDSFEDLYFISFSIF